MTHPSGLMGCDFTDKVLLKYSIMLIYTLYLMYLAVRSLFAKVDVVEPTLVKYNNSKINLLQYFRMGFICNLTNPKAFMFIVALSTYIAENGNPYFDGTIILLGSTIATCGWFTCVSLMFSHIRIRQMFYKKQRLINSVFGCILLYIAYKIMFFN